MANNKQEVSELSKREQQVLRALSHGKRQADIAGELSISVDTVKETVSRASKKLNAATSVQAVAEAIRRGVL